MKAICKTDFKLRVKAHDEAIKANDVAKKRDKYHQSVNIPEIGFYDIYGVWFYGRLKSIIRQISLEKYEEYIGEQMHVFVDVEPKKISDGIHEVSVYEHPCKLYKWLAQGYHRGLVVLADDELGNKEAEIYRNSGTWSWILNDW